MTVFICHKCKVSYDKTGSCNKCGTALERVCPVCREEIDFCVCTADIPQTKGPGPH